MSQHGEEAGQRGTEEETASPLQWSRGGLAGRITGGGEGDARVMSVTDRVRRSSSPSSSSEQLDLQSSSAPQESAQHHSFGLPYNGFGHLIPILSRLSCLYNFIVTQQQACYCGFMKSCLIQLFLLYSPLDA